MSDANDAHRPTPIHPTDQCYDELLQYGFCGHALFPLRADRPLRPEPPTTPTPTPTSPRPRSTRRSILSWTGFTCLAIFTYITATRLSFPAFSAALVLSGTGWMLTFLYGLPYALFHYDISAALPPDVRERLDGDSQNTKKGPDATP